MTNFEINEQFEGRWRVTWKNLSTRNETALRHNMVLAALRAANKPVGFSLSPNGERAFTRYIDLEFSDDHSMNTGSIKCCMFESKKEAEDFVNELSKLLVWNTLTATLKKDYSDDDGCDCGL